MCQQLIGVVCPPRIHISLCKLHMARRFAWEKANRSFWAFYHIHVVLCYLNMCYKSHFVSIYLLDNGEKEKIQPETFQSNSNICLVGLWYDHMTGNTIIFLPSVSSKGNRKAKPIDCHWMVKCPVQVQIKTNWYFPYGDITEAFILQSISKALLVLQECRSKK